MSNSFHSIEYEIESFSLMNASTWGWNEINSNTLWDKVSRLYLKISFFYNIEGKKIFQYAEECLVLLKYIGIFYLKKVSSLIWTIALYFFLNSIILVFINRERKINALKLIIIATSNEMIAIPGIIWYDVSEYVLATYI